MADFSRIPSESADHLADPLLIMGKRISAIDVLVYALFLALGAVQLTGLQAADNYYNYPGSYEVVRSVLSQGFYGFDGRFETLYPPGGTYIFALIAVVFGLNRIVFARSMTVFLTLALMASYSLLKRKTRRTFAAAACLLLASSPDIFAFSTQLISTELPYLFVTVVCFILGTKLDAAQRLRTKIILGLLFSLSLALALMIRTAAIAVLAALIAWLAVSFLQDAKRAKLRLLCFLPGLLLGLAVQVTWMRWADTHTKPEWPIPGWPGSYFPQLALRNGNDPDLGQATLADIPGRVERNLLGHAEWFARLLLHKGWKPEWYSPGTAGATLLVLLGLGRSFWRMRGDLVDWYFVGYEVMLLLWPWNLELRFVLPIVPFAPLYLWRGGQQLTQFGTNRPVMVGGIATLVASALALAAGPHEIKSFVFWTLLASLSFLLATTAFLKPAAIASATSTASQTTLSFEGRGLSVAQALIVTLVAVLFGTGLAGQVAIARENLHYDPTKNELYPQVEAAQWIESHTAASAVVMARRLDVVYHFCHRRVVWFPPIGHPDTLMEGIRKYHIAWVIVTEERDSYFRPAAKECLELLEHRYPGQFQLVNEGPHYQIYAVANQK